MEKYDVLSRPRCTVVAAAQAWRRMDGAVLNPVEERTSNFWRWRMLATATEVNAEPPWPCPSHLTSLGRSCSHMHLACVCSTIQELTLPSLVPELPVVQGRQHIVVRQYYCNVDTEIKELSAHFSAPKCFACCLCETVLEEGRSWNPACH